MLNGKSLALGLKLAQASLGLFERFGSAVSLLFDPRQLFALVAVLIGSLRRFVLPWRSALSDFGPLAHHARSSRDPAAGDGRFIGHRSEEDGLRGESAHLRDAPANRAYRAVAHAMPRDQGM